MKIKTFFFKGFLITGKNDQMNSAIMCALQQLTARWAWFVLEGPCFVGVRVSIIVLLRCSLFLC